MLRENAARKLLSWSLSCSKHLDERICRQMKDARISSLLCEIVLNLFEKQLSASCRQRHRTTRCISIIVLHTKVDALSVINWRQLSVK